ncbi:unnamed protein product, partial [Mesorhabditis spiculigera]
METLISLTNTGINLNKPLLERLCAEIGDRQVGVIAITGKFRGGKSFTCNSLLRRLQKGDKKPYLPDEVIGGPGQIPFQTGYVAHTMGIQVWPKIFKKKGEDGKEMAMLLLDTQGTFDTQSEPELSMRTSLIALLLSSFTIQNSKELIDSQQLAHISSFLALARKNQEKIGQNFFFLIRDQAEDTGLAHGKAYLDYVKVSARRSPELLGMMTDLESAFEKLDACLLVPPADAVRTASDRILAKDCGNQFLEQLNECADHAVTSCKPKTVLGNELNGMLYKSYVEKICDEIKSMDLKCISSAFTATAMLTFELAKKAGNDVFDGHFQKITAATINESVPPTVIQRQADQAVQAALQVYDTVKCIGSAFEKQTSREHFESNIKNRCENLVERNNTRSLTEKLGKSVKEAKKIYKNGFKSGGNLFDQNEAVESDRLREKHAESMEAAFELFDRETRDVRPRPTVNEARQALFEKFTQMHTERSRENAHKLLKNTLIVLAETSVADLGELCAELADHVDLESEKHSLKRRVMDQFDEDAPAMAKHYEEHLEKRTIDEIIQWVIRTELIPKLGARVERFILEQTHARQIRQLEEKLKAIQEDFDEQQAHLVAELDDRQRYVDDLRGQLEAQNLMLEESRKSMINLMNSYAN